ncbi:Uncharacterised protein [Enterobacter hormaechei]|nr:Uncharacterised protein [Enterobacter hormaechei]
MSIHFSSSFRLRIHPGGFQALTFLFNAFQLLVEARPALVIHQTQLAAHLGQTQIGIVFAQHQAIFRTRSKHAVRFFGPQRAEIVDQNAQVSLRTRRCPALFLGREASGVQTGQQPLRGSFFVPGGAVNLACEEQTLDEFAFQRRLQVTRIEEIVLNSVARTNDLRVFHALH